MDQGGCRITEGRSWNLEEDGVCVVRSKNILLRKEEEAEVLYSDDLH
jgi:hypothetical protein